MEAVVPCPLPPLTISIDPSFALMKVDAIQKPRPEPGIVAWWRRLRHDRRPSCCCSSGVIPTPWSEIDRMTCPCTARVLTEIVDPDGEYLAAFSRSWPQASLTRAESTLIIGRSSSNQMLTL